MTPNVLITDLDGTLLGDDAALERFARWAMGERDRWSLVYATGRSVASVRRAVATTVLPEPSAIIADVGTTIVDGGMPQQEWPVDVSRWDPGVVRTALRSTRGLTLQDPMSQTAHKVSFHTFQLHRMDLVHIARALRAHGLRARLIHSEGRNLDVVPRATGKGAAARWLMARWGIDPAQVICAGDSGNDRDLLRVGGTGIVVANARPELGSLRGPTIFHAREAFADGVLEGVSRTEPNYR